MGARLDTVLLLTYKRKVRCWNNGQILKPKGLTSA
nr:MAG TPA: hypothetical protein [Caudoviricetes sp.]